MPCEILDLLLGSKSNTAELIGQLRGDPFPVPDEGPVEQTEIRHPDRADAGHVSANRSVHYCARNFANPGDQTQDLASHRLIHLVERRPLLPRAEVHSSLHRDIIVGVVLDPGLNPLGVLLGEREVGRQRLDPDPGTGEGNKLRLPTNSSSIR